MGTLSMRWYIPHSLLDPHKAEALSKLILTTRLAGKHFKVSYMAWEDFRDRLINGTLNTQGIHCLFGTADLSLDLR